MGGLVVDNIAQAEGAGKQHDADQREAEGKFIADQLSTGAQCAEERVLVVRGPAGERNSIDPYPGNSQQNQQADIYVGDLE